MKSVPANKSPLYEMTQTTPTSLWNDSSSLSELAYSIEHGAVGATCNPVIVVGTLKKELAEWKSRIELLIARWPQATEDEIAWLVVREMTVQAAALLQPIYDSHAGRNGRLSIQTDPRLFRDANAMVAQAEEFHQLAPNVIVKIPATRAGISAMEEATYRGISVNATVCFTVPQCLAVAEAIEQGLKRREGEQKDIATMGPVCTIMVGRIDDWLKLVADRDNIVTNPCILDWAGVAILKKTYRIFRERGYRLRLLSAAFRNHMHWSEFIGGDVVISPPYSWQLRFNSSDVAAIPRMDHPVDPKTVHELIAKFSDFRRSYSEGGLTLDEFDCFGPTRRTLRQFIGACAELNSMVRDIMLPEP